VTWRYAERCARIRGRRHAATALIGVAVGLGLMSGTVSAAPQTLPNQTSPNQTWPNRPIEIVVPFAAGGSIDITFRLIGARLSERLGQSVIILNKPGAGGTIGMSEVARAAPDGHTLGAASFAFAANSAVLKKLPFDPLKDFAPVTMVARAPLVLLVNAKMPPRTMQEFIDWVKSKPPGELNYGSPGIGSSGHLMTELFLSRAGIKMTHIIYTNGGTPGLAQGDIHLQFSPTPRAVGWINDKRLVAIAVTSLQPDPIMPELPPVSATLPGFDTYEWPGLVAPAKTPRSIIDRIHQEITQIVAESIMKERFATLGSQPVASTPEEFDAHIRRETALWAGVVRNLDLALH
jgi:tripartite-type tricarboxylate transporter receptor subunit TctC